VTHWLYIKGIDLTMSKTPNIQRSIITKENGEKSFLSLISCRPLILEEVTIQGTFSRFYLL